jgi:hypothetical protein
VIEMESLNTSSV